MKEKLIQFGKLLFFILFTPVIVAASTGFCKEVSLLPADHRYYLISGGAVYLIIHLFIFEPKFLYDFGHHLVSQLFSFFAPLVRIAPYVVPIYTFLILMVYFVTSAFFPSARQWDNVYLFLIGFTLVMHLVFTARSLREGGGESGPSNYLFSMSWIYVVNLFFMAMFFDLVLPKFSFPSFFQTTVHVSGFVYHFIVHQLFFS